MNFQVPQFIEVEDKIFGPLTAKQFVYLAGGGGMIFVLIRLLPLFIGIIISIPVAALVAALAFYKVNNKPFVYFLENAFYYVKNNKLYLWKKEEKTPEKMAKKEEEIESLLYVPRMADSKLKDMTWSLDVAKDAINPVTRDAAKYVNK